MKKICSNILVLLSIIMVALPARAALFNAEEFFLDNGLQVIVIPNHKAPIIKHMVWYKAGAVDEKPGKGGSAHLLEHLMFRGTSKVKGSEFNAVLEKHGAESNAFTGNDFTAYHQSLDISKLELAMALEADRMQNLEITPEDFKLERNIVYQERMQVVENDPAAFFKESLRRTLWQTHPYARPITGTPEEIMNLTLKDVREFYDNFYSPDNAILILSGDIDVATARKLAEKYYGNIPARKIGKKAEFPPVKQQYNASLHMKLPQINSPRVSEIYLAPSYNTDKNAAYALELFAKYLGEGATSKLYKKLVLEQKLALSVSVSYDSSVRGHASFTVSALPAEGVTVEELHRAVNVAVDDSLNEYNREEQDKLLNKLLSGLVYLRDNPFDAAYIIGAMESVGYPLDEIENQDKILRKISVADVKSAARRLLTEAPKVSGTLEPEKGVAK